VDDVAMVNAGLILFGDENQEDGKHSFGSRSMLVDHEREHGISGLVTLIGVRATMARGMAESALDLVQAKLGRERETSKTAWTPIFGGGVSDFEGLVTEIGRQCNTAVAGPVLRCLGHNYGSAYKEVLAFAGRDGEGLSTLGSSTTLKAEAIHAVRKEMAQKLADVVFRRTDLGTAGDPGEDALADCASIVAAELGWDRSRMERELEEVRSFLAGRGRSRNFQSTVLPGLQRQTIHQEI
jgi:glycerol-3-phosphate dehydrogenase